MNPIPRIPAASRSKIGEIAPTTVLDFPRTERGLIVWKWRIGGGVRGRGTFTTGERSPDGSYLITEMTGQINGETIASLLQPGTFGPNDNLLYETEERLTNLGVSFIAGDLPRNLFFFDSHELLTARSRPVAVSFEANPSDRRGFFSTLFRSRVGA